MLLMHHPGSRRDMQAGGGQRIGGTIQVTWTDHGVGMTGYLTQG